MKRNDIIIYGAIIGVIAILVLFVFLQPSIEGKYDDFAKCLTNSGAKMYGTDRCSHCSDQKILFGSSFSHVNYINCDYQRNECIAAGVDRYPTWIINNKVNLGSQSLATLASLSGCSLE